MAITFVRRAAVGALMTLASVPHIQAQTTTVEVVLPGWDQEAWNNVEGSIVGVDKALTTYRLQCGPDAQDSDCKFLDGPMTFAENSETMTFSRSSAGAWSKNISCALAGTTSASCHYYTTVASGQQHGTLTGPDTYSEAIQFAATGGELAWVKLAVATPADLVITVTGSDTGPTATGTSSTGAGPTETGTSSSGTPTQTTTQNGAGVARWTWGVAFGSLMLCSLL
ncbi:hypothetical protein JX265_013226 [Neoarthrinium moseri]|uniref:Uncharacterized protein n=1 Tax=Neoarthrinium moseri TaxID=1658444 RepID=A0A9P9W945_9PEZI|nr:uncharacterized protein JN550_006669 [Neoarthrinium moseri]KAI1840544.1 hypothetical protein JX266_013273 [Neoarthrinium moseri]KAI1851479.1 hypothetical protein JX265_013226 [Neoarthrinium moseri]KAI1867862.1 hypothetical protein JN550_006669 [Neoarthrinium moseri]